MRLGHLLERFAMRATHVDEEELQTLRSHFQKLSQMAKRDSRLTASHSI